MRAIAILSAALLVLQCRAADDNGKKTAICFAILRAYFDIRIVDTKGLMILKNVFSRLMVFYPNPSVQIAK